jgi:glycosyltransferase involved in cell wall biosynthesis
VPHDILHILGTARPEGSSIARVVGMLSEGLDRRRFRMHAWFLDGDGPLANELHRRGVQVRVVGWCGRVRDPLGMWRYFRALDGHSFSIIHQHFGGRASGYLARKRTGARLILHVWAPPQSSAFIRSAPIPVPGADAVITCSRAMAERITSAAARVVYPGLSPAEYADFACPVGRTGRVFGTAARIVPEKGIVYAIRALALLSADFTDLRFEIAGSGEEQARLEAEAEALGIKDRVSFIGWRSDIAAVMSRWDIFVFPSLEEPFGLAALDAMALCLPVVATAAGGLPEVVEEGRTGFLVPPADPAALAERIRTLMLDPKLRLSMGTAARERVQKHFSAEQMCAGIAEIYDELLAAPLGN